jgi:hypothetical protein
VTTLKGQYEAETDEAKKAALKAALDDAETAVDTASA